MADPSAAPWLAANLQALTAALGADVTLAGGGPWLATTTADGVSLQLRTPAGTLVAAHSRRQPGAEAARLIDAALAGRPAPPIAIVIGAGLGAGVDDLFGRDASIRVLVIEPDPSGAAAFLAHRDWRTPIGEGRLLVLAGPDFRGAERAWRFVPGGAPTPLIVVHPVLAREYPDDVRRAAAVGARVVGDARANAGAETALAGPYLLNTIANLGVIAREGDVAALDGAFEGVPAIVVAAGPSLDRVVADVARLQDRALVVTVDTALRPLLAQGIAPHLGVAVDPSEGNARHLADLDGAHGTWLVAEPGVHPTACPAFAGRTFTFRVGDNHPWPWLASLGVSRGTLTAWGSVLVSALDLAIRTGARPIAIVGADLAYTGGQPYCRGTAFEADWAREVRWGSPLADVWARVAGRPGAQEREDVHGRPVPTLPHLVAFRDRLLDQIAASGVRIVNASGGGILHGRDLEVATLDAVLGDAPHPGALRARLRQRHAASLAPATAAAALATALSRAETAPALAAMVPGVEHDRVASRIAAARTAIAAPTTTMETAPAPAPRSAVEPIWWPEQTAALAALDEPGAASRAPMTAVAAADGGLEPVLASARVLRAREVLVVPPLDDEPIGRDLLALPLPLVLPFAAAARADATRFSAVLTRWIAAAPTRSGDPESAFWSIPPEPIDAATDIGRAARAPDGVARIAIATTLAAAAARVGVTDPTLSRLSRAVGQGWRRVTGEAPRTARVGLVLVSGDEVVPWIDDAPLAALTRALSGVMVTNGTIARQAPPDRSLRLRASLAIDTGAGWEPAGTSIASDPAWMLSPHPCAASLHACAADDGHAVVTRQDGQGSYLVDERGRVTPAPAWPAPVFAEGPFDAAGAWYAWTLHSPRLLIRTPGGIAHDVPLPFTPTSASPDGEEGLRFSALDGVWRWSAADGLVRLVESAPLVAAWPDGHAGFELAVFPPTRDGRRARTGHGLMWSSLDGVREIGLPPLGPCWSRSTRRGVTAAAFPDAGLVRISDATGVRGWVVSEYPRTVAWAGASLVIVTTDGRVTLVPGVDRALA